MTSSHSYHLRTAIFLSVVSPALACAAPREYSVLTIAEGPNDTVLTSVNNRGEIAGLFGETRTYGFLTQPYLPVNLDDLLGRCRIANDVSNRGVVIGRLSIPNHFGIWFSNGVFREIHDEHFPEWVDPRVVYPEAVDDRVLVAGYVVSQRGSVHGWIYDIRADHLEMLDESLGTGRVTDVNNDPLIIAETADGTLRWDADGVPDFIPGIRGLALNNLNYIVGTSPFDRPVFWDSTGVNALPRLPDLVEGAAVDVNDNNLAVGSCNNGFDVFRAAVWHLDSREAVDLNERIDPALGLHLSFANSINDKGEIIAAGPLGDFLLAPIPMDLTVDNLRAGQTAVARASGCESGAEVWFFYTLRGEGDAPAWWDTQFGVPFDLIGPTLRGRSTANADGIAVFPTRIEPAAANLEVWIQAYHIGNKSNIVNAVVMP